MCAPSPHDGHHAHELVGRAARRALEAFAGPVPHLWLWGVWADLPFPTLVVPFHRPRLEEIRHALAAHASELARLPLDTLLEARAILSAGAGEERVYGSGVASDPDVELAELICEVALTGRLAAPARRAASSPKRRSPAGGAPDRLVARPGIRAFAPAARDRERESRPRPLTSSN